MPGNNSTRRNFLELILGGTALATMGAVFYPVFKYITPPIGGEAKLSQLKLSFTKADIEPINVNFDDYDQVFLCTPVYMQGISPAIKAVIKEVPMKNKEVSVFATCGGFYGSLMHWFVKRSIRAKGADVQNLYVVKVGGKTDGEIKDQTSAHLNTILDAG